MELLGLRSAVLFEAGFRHAFFMRKGGASAAPFASLSFSTGVGDTAEAVADNLARAGRELGVEPAHIYFLDQVHGCQSQCISGAEDREALQRVEGDITLSRVDSVACGVRMADCAAVLLADRTSGAVAAIHSGWRGTVRGVVGAGVEALRDLVGAPCELLAAVGPHIERCCFEVGEDVAGQLAACTAAGDVVIRSVGRKPHVDLRRIIHAQLRDCGVQNIDHVAGCTMCDAQLFHSYRRDGPRSGRMLAAIVARADAQ